MEESIQSLETLLQEMTSERERITRCPSCHKVATISDDDYICDVCRDEEE